jgi:hypothetical protein
MCGNTLMKTHYTISISLLKRKKKKEELLKEIIQTKPKLIPEGNLEYQESGLGVWLR